MKKFMTGADRPLTIRLESDTIISNEPTTLDQSIAAMNDPDSRIGRNGAPPESATLRAEALAWLRRLNSGEATGADMLELEQWRSRTPAHAREFAEVALLWTVLGEAAERAQAIYPARTGILARRAFLAGGAAVAASVAGTLMIRPPFDLWPSFSEFAADYRTRTGERRQIELAESVSVEMNTRTSIDMRPAANGIEQIELLAGETAIAKRDDSFRELVVFAGGGEAAATQASFNVRKDGQSVSVTCIDGNVRVRCPAGTAAIHDGQQIIYDDQRLGDITTVDPEVVTAWQRGLLIFRRASLAQVIDEVNRYRSGRIVLLDAKLGQRQVVATFRLDRIDDAIDFMSKAMNIAVRPLPGHIVLVG
jgi:transmembrane sensor